MTTRQRSILDKWLNFVYDEHDNFFFLCPTHRFNVTRPEDGVLESDLAKTMPCDYPKCKALSQIEYFPNLFPEFKGYSKSRADARQKDS